MNLEIIKAHKKKIMLALVIPAALLLGYYYYYNFASYCDSRFKKQGCACTTSDGKLGHWAPTSPGSTELYCKPDRV